MLASSGERTPPTQWATSASRCRWTTAGWNVRCVSLGRCDMSSSTLVTWLRVDLLAVVALVATSSRSGSMLLLICWMTASRRPMPQRGWPHGSVARCGRHTVTCSGPAVPGMSRCRTQLRCSPSSCRCRSSHESAGTPASRAGRCRRWSPKPWRSSWPGPAESPRDGERAGGRDRVRLRSPAGRGTVSGLPHPGPRTTVPQRAGWSGSELC